MIVKTKYADLLRYISPSLRLEKDLPLRDNFFLVKDLFKADVTKMSRFSNYIVVSNYFFDSELGRDEIINLIKEKKPTRRNPKHDYLSDEEFEVACKILYTAGMWIDEDEEEAPIFQLFKDMGSARRSQSYIELTKHMPPRVILYSLLTFVVRCHDENYMHSVSKGYSRVIKLNRNKVIANFSSAISLYDSMKELPEEIRVFNFVNALGV